jgi:HAD superfamily hydrolase (TIGR01490 family)
MTAGVPFAFFDIDGTLIYDLSMLSFYELYLRRADVSTAASVSDALGHLKTRLGGALATRETRNAMYYNIVFANMPVGLAQALCEEWISTKRIETGFWIPGMLTRLSEHKRAGIVPVLVTGSFREVARAIGSALGVENWISAPLEELDGRYTGRLTAEPMVGLGKLAAVRRFALQHAVSLGACFAYGDDDSDIPMLDGVGHPAVVDTAPHTLLAYAAQRGWPVVASR